jgi:hypothetical protein
LGYHPEAELKGFPSQGGVPPWEEMRNPGVVFAKDALS